jgi:hypothetical protein
MSAVRCQICQEPGEAFCRDHVACNFRARIRLGIPAWQARRERGRDLATYSRANGGRAGERRRAA